MSGSTAQPPSPRRRVDAERNRAHLIEVAREALESSGQTTMQSIARTAGVGQGTLYRHFATREALLLEVYQGSFARLVEAVDVLLASQPPAVALRSWLDELARFGREKHALAEVLDAASRHELHDRQYAPILDAIGRLLDAGAVAGSLRRDVRPDEVLPLVGFLWHLDTSNDERIPHLLDVVVDGLRAQRVSLA